MEYLFTRRKQRVDELKCNNCKYKTNGHLCIGFIDKREEEFNSILMFWKVQGLYDREKINKLLDDFEQSYDRLFNQE